MLKFAITMMLLPTTAFAHDFYDAFCCNGNQHNGDCQAISSKLVEITKDGYKITAGKGDHRLITKPHVYFSPTNKARQSPDGDYHMCLYPTENTLRCFYAPDFGS